jgi:hypothetical protein
MRRAIVISALVAAVAGCSSPPSASPTATAPLVDAHGAPIPSTPTVPGGPLSPSLTANLDVVFGDLGVDVDEDAIARVGESGDIRAGWLLTDLLRFTQRGHVAEAAEQAFEQLAGGSLTDAPAWSQAADWLIAWDVPAPPGYLEWKRRLFVFFEPGWAPFFDDPNADVDWRLLTWGGVGIDDRPLAEVRRRCPDGCIPALDDPAVTDAAGGGWYPDDRVVFGVVIDGETRAYPKNVMEVHELVNDTLGGRRLGLVYCTLCGSAQAYLTDAVPAGFETLELRTSGLLFRSNKVMFDLHTSSAFDTFAGRAVTGPLHDAGFTLEMITVRTSTWGRWKAAHPDTTIVASDGGIGMTYPDNPLQGRDDEGPIFPVGLVDPRLPAQEPVLGVVTPDGTAVAFPVARAMLELDAGRPVAAAGVRVRTDGAGLAVETLDGQPIPSHQAYWFAWSQFHPGTVLWTPAGAS